MMAAKNLEESVAHVIDTARNITTRVAELEHERDTCLNRLRGQPGVKGTTLDQAVHAMCAELMRLREQVQATAKQLSDAGLPMPPNVVDAAKIVVERMAYEHQKACEYKSKLDELEQAKGNVAESGVVAYAVIREALSELSGYGAMSLVTLDHIKAIKSRLQALEHDAKAANGELAKALADLKDAWRIIDAMHEAAVGEKRPAAPTGGLPLETYVRDVRDAITGCVQAERHKHAEEMDELKTESEGRRNRIKELEALLNHPHLSLCNACQKNPDSCTEGCAAQEAAGPGAVRMFHCAAFLPKVPAAVNRRGAVVLETRPNGTEAALKALRELVDSGTQEVRLQAAHLLLTLGK